MRAVRVLGLAEDGREVVCEDPTTGEKFVLPRDERLRAASRGDLSRFGQLEIEGESQLRPREIQSRIRAGASVEELAALAGTSVRRIERFAYPVLVERSTMAERARQARPSIDGISAGSSVTDTVAATLAARGHDGSVSWDAYRDNDDWVLTLTWQAGRSENRAHWTFHPGPAGGTLTARDEGAAEIVDPALRVLRPLREARTEPAAAVGLIDPTVPTVPILPTEPAGPAARPEANLFDRRVAPQPDESENLAEQIVSDERSAARPEAKRAEIAKTGTDGAAPGPSGSARAGRKSGRPAMPSWEDVLLGTKSHDR